MALNTRGIDFITANLDGRLRSDRRRTIRRVFRRSQELVVVRSGELKRSGEIETVDAFTDRVVYRAGHAPYVEFGNDNPNYPAQPFLTPAVRQIVGEGGLFDDVRDLLRG